MPLINDVEIELDGEDFTLRPSLKAAQAVSTRFGGFQNAMTAVASSDLAALTFVIRQGVPLKAISTKDLEDAVWNAGIRKMAGPAMKFIGRLANGGRDPDLEEDESTEPDGDEGESGNDLEV